ncbi:MAG TPA: hypothetical protein VIW23_08565 [Candidatus Acidoferrum sp.]|jgi:hypothetical protein
MQDQRLHIVDQKLQDIACPVSLFVPICGGIIGRTRLTQALKHDDLDQNTVDKLVAILDEMAELKSVSLIAPDWSDAVNIQAQLKARRELKHAVAFDDDDVRKAFAALAGIK